ncbi:methyltransferase, TIGR04325 family [Ramlibacter sp.]|uniref:methyltransferase, TIGR04325 family n=1 Tax=Ramlibacter sp. TaxID=1917967 RepID=UPI002CAF8FD5|nr:methyltransferase, TIGR04325 family [Ramlibacter sp.]HWI83123.1 methyltransferase, TIGR04325 family [Ramlibacter sp.]
MIESLKFFGKQWLPPVIAGALRGNRLGRTRFEGPYASWSAAAARSSGYDAAAILDKVLAAVLAVKRGEAVFERDSVLFHSLEYSWPVATALMAAAARAGGQLNVLDYGGSLGSTYFQYRRLHAPLASVRWNVVEQEHFVRSGRQLEDGTLRFYETTGDCLRENVPNVVLASSVLQYLQQPAEVISELASAGATYLIVDRTPLTGLSQDVALVQHVDPAIYEASYPMWALSEQLLRDSLEPAYACVTDFQSPEGRLAVGQAVEVEFKGMLFERRR